MYLKKIKYILLALLLLCLTGCDAADAEETVLPENETVIETETEAETAPPAEEAGYDPAHAYIFANPEDAGVWISSQALLRWVIYVTVPIVMYPSS